MGTLVATSSAGRGVEELKDSPSLLAACTTASMPLRADKSLESDLSHRLECISTDVARGLIARALGLKSLESVTQVLAAFEKQAATVQSAREYKKLGEAALTSEAQLLVGLGAAALKVLSNDPTSISQLGVSEARLVRVALAEAVKASKPLSTEEKALAETLVLQLQASPGGTPSHTPVSPGMSAAGTPSIVPGVPVAPPGTPPTTVPPMTPPVVPPISPPVVPPHGPHGIVTGGHGPGGGGRGTLFPGLTSFFGKFSGLGPIERYKLAATGATILSGIAGGIASKYLFAFGVAALFPTMAAAGPLMGVGVGIWLGCILASKVNGFALKWMAKKIDAQITAPLRNATKEDERPHPILARFKKARDLLASQMGLQYVMDRVDAVVYVRQRMDSGIDPVRALHKVLDKNAKSPTPESRKEAASLWRQAELSVERIEKGDPARKLPGTQHFEALVRHLRPEVETKVEAFLNKMSSAGPGSPGFLLREDIERSGINGFSFASPGRLTEWVDFAARHTDPGVRLVAEHLEEYIKGLDPAGKQEWKDLRSLDLEYQAAWNGQIEGLGIRQQVRMLDLFEKMTVPFVACPPKSTVPYPAFYEEFADPSAIGGKSRRQVVPSLKEVLYSAKLQPGGLSIRSSGGVASWMKAAKDNPNQEVLLGEYLQSSNPADRNRVQVTVQAKDILAALNGWVGTATPPPGDDPYAVQWKRVLQLDSDYAEALTQYKASDIIFDEIMVKLRGVNEEAAGTKVNQFQPKHDISILGFGQPVYEFIHARLGGRRYSSQWRRDMRDTPDYDLAQTLVAYCQLHKYVSDLCDIWSNEDRLTKNAVKQNIEGQVNRVEGLKLEDQIKHDTSIVNQIIYRYHPLSLFPRHFFDHTIHSDNPKVAFVLPLYAFGGGIAGAAGVLPGLFNGVSAVGVAAGSYAWSSIAKLISKRDEEAGNKKS